MISETLPARFTQTHKENLMNISTTNSFLPSKCRILSGSVLKLIAMITMLIDHTAAFLLRYYQPATEPLFSIKGASYSFYRVCRDVGRVAFPIFCFLLVEGFLHTRDRRKYAGNLLIFALISEIPWNFAQGGTLLYSQKQNVFFTLFLGFLGIYAIEYFWEKQIMQLACLTVLFAAAYYLKADYGWKGYIFILIMYGFRHYGAAQAVIGSCWLHYEWKACFAFLSINMYNGERGFIKGKAAKYFFYLFYPLHITILVILRKIFFHV